MNRFINKILRIFRKKYFAIVFLFVCVISVLGVTYSYWSAESGWNLASELKFKELNYYMRIDDVNTNTITSPANSGTVYYTIAVTSLNEINTRYSLTYKSNVSGVTVKVSTSSINDTNGIIGLYESGTGGEKTKTIRIAITNTTASAATIEFEVIGGYAWNPETDITVNTGYSRITQTHTETQIETGLLLSEELNRIMDCTPTATSACLLKENSANYLSYSGHTWRIMGTYLVGGEYLTKLVLNEPLSTKVAYANVSSELATFYSTLNTSQIKTGAPFTCTGTTDITCTGSENIGLVSKAEYDATGGVNSYLYTKPNKEYWLGNTYYVGTSRGIENKDNTATAYVRPAIYLKENTIDTAKSNTTKSITNLVTNGSFENGLTGWTTYGGSQEIIKNQAQSGYRHLKSIPNSTYDGVYSGYIAFDPTDIIYFSGYYKKTGGGVARLYIYDFHNQLYPPGLNFGITEPTTAWTKFSLRSVATYPQLQVFPFGSSNQYVAGMFTEYDSFLLINLTEEFGIGNEPSKEWCDENLEYFDGTSSIVVKSGTVGTITNPYEVATSVHLTVNLNGGTSNLKSGNFLPGSYPITLSRYGYTFNGWTVTGAGTSATANSLTLGSADATLTANWTLITYSIAYTLNGGTTSNPTTYTLFDLPLTLSVPAKTNFVFNGWTGSNGSTLQTSVTINESNVGNKSYTANFTCTCVYYLGCSTNYSPEASTTSKRCYWTRATTGGGCGNTNSVCNGYCPAGCYRGAMWCCYIYETSWETRNCPTGATQAGLYCRLYNQTSCASPYSVQAL